jgi:hypothetical protein
VHQLQRTIGNRAVASLIQRTRAVASGAASPLVRDGLAAPGLPLDEGTRTFFETRFSCDLSEVRVHADERAARSAAAADAQAFTVGGDVVFAAGRYAPHTAEGRRLLAHELAHVVQQRGHGTAPPSDAHGLHEREADAVATSVETNAPFDIQHRTAVGVARAPAQVSPNPPPRIEANYRTVETEFVENGVRKVRITVFGTIGDPSHRPGLDLKFPLGGEVGLPGYVRWHLVGPGATGGESGILTRPSDSI